jgi:parallel beta-helix repeat protein
MATNHQLRRKLKRRGFRPLFEQMEDRRLLATWTVDDDFVGVGCDSSDRRCETIQEAVDAANAGDTIKVKAGTYNENVEVDKKLTITGIGNPTVDPVDTDAGLPDFATAYGFFLNANDIAIKGFNIQDNSPTGDGSSDADNTVGIGTSNQFSGYKISGNTIQGNTFGIYLNTDTSNGAHFTEVKGNFFDSNNEAGAASGNGIYSDQGARKVRIQNNKFRGHDNCDVLFTNAGVAGTPLQIGITIKGNSSVSSGNGFEFIGVQFSEISNNNIFASNFNGVQLSGSDINITVKNNTMKNVGTQGFSGVRLLNQFPELGTTNNSNILIQGNSITNAGLTGIRMADTDNSIVRGNTVIGSKGFDLSVEGWGNGISLENSSNNTIDGNTLKLNARHGLFVDENSVSNLIKNNVSVANAQLTPKDPSDPDSGGFDYRDLSIDDGTAGTANTYRNNAGRTDNPHGLIQRHI